MNQRRSEHNMRKAEGNKDIEQEISYPSKFRGLELYDSLRCEAMLEARNMCVNEFELLRERGNSLIFIPDQS